MELRSLFVRIRGDTKDLEKKLTDANALIDDFKQGLQSISAAASLDAVAADMKDVDRAAEAAAQALDGVASDMKDVDRAADGVAKSAAETADALKDVDRAADQIAGAAPAATKGLTDLGQGAQRAAKGVREAESAWDKFKKDFTKGFQFSAGMEAFNLLQSGLQELGTGLINGIRLTANYEQTMNVLQATSSASAAEMAELSEKAKALGSDMSLPGTSAADAATAMLELNKAGLNLNQTMDASKGVLQLSAAAQIDNATAAQITANALNTFGLSGGEATRVADLLAAGANASSASMTDLSQGLQQAGFAFEATGQSIDDLVTGVAALTNVGLSGSDAGTALKNAMLQLAAPTKEAQQTMNALGINVRDAQGNMLKFPDLIDHLRSRLEDLSPAQRDAALKTMLQSDGMKAMIPLLKLGEDGFLRLKNQVMEQGAAAKVAEAQNKGFNGALDALQSQAESLAINVLEPLLPLMTGIVGGLATTVGWIGDNLPPVLAAAASGALAWAAANGTLTISFAGATAGIAKFMAAALPIAAIGATVGGVVLAFNHLTDTATTATERIRERSTEWQRGVEAMEAYRLAQENTIASMRGMADAEAEELERLIALRDEKLKRATGDGALNWLSAAFDTEEVTQQHINEINELDARILELSGTLTQATDSTNTNTEAARRNEEAMRLSREGYVNYAQLTGEQAGRVTQAFQATNEAIEESEKILKRIEDQGPAAMGAMISTAAGFLGERETAQAEHEAKLVEIMATGNQAQIDQENEAYRAQELAAAESYANQQAAQRAHLGVMLIDWINAQAMVDSEFAAKSGELVNAIAAQYGVVADSTQVVFGAQLNAIRGYVEGTIPSLDTLMATLDQNEDEAIATQRAMEELQQKYIAELVTKWETGGYGTGPEAADAYRRELEGVPGRVYTEITAEASEAQAAADRTQAVYDRMDRKIETQLDADPTGAQRGADAATTAIENTPTSHTTTFKVDASSIAGEMRNAGQNAVDSFANALASGAGRAAASAAQMARAASAAAKAALGIASPSKEFMEIGRFVDEGLAAGIKAHSKDPEAALERLGRDMVGSYEDYLDAMAQAEADYVASQAQIWQDYYADLERLTEQFNGDKFDQQLDFYDNIANLDAASRQTAMQEQEAAWATAQEMAQAGLAAEADIFYQAALAHIEADQERARRLAQIGEDIAAKKRQLAEEEDAERRARLEAEIAELEQREAFLQEVDKQRDARAAEELERLKNQDSALAEERDAALGEAQTDYQEATREAQDEFAAAFQSIREGFTGVGRHTRSTADEIIAAYARIVDAAHRAADEVAATRPAEARQIDGSHAGGLAYVPHDNYIGELHQGEAVLTKPEARIWREMQAGSAPATVMSAPSTTASAPASQRPVIIKQLAETIVVREDADIQRIAAAVASRIKRGGLA